MMRVCGDGDRMADRWNESGSGGLQNMTNIWLPFIPPSAAHDKWTLNFLDEWKLSDF